MHHGLILLLVDLVHARALSLLLLHMNVVDARRFALLVDLHDGLTVARAGEYHLTVHYGPRS